jgi:LmbE family N-acetylglucosaminyl deacetylase
VNKSISLVCLLLGLLLPLGQLNAQRIELPDAAELQIALHKLNVLGSVLFVAAHPDDENTSALAYFSKGRKFRTAYLSLTRGDGGQNLIGPEKGAEIGIIRTQELMAARRIDGAEQFFTRAIDFGYSKTPEETLKFWGREEILADLVWIIRRFRPDVIITRFAVDVSSGHGHHTASGWLIRDAYLAASDPDRFPEQLKHVEPWKAKRLYWNSWRPGEQELQDLQKFDTGEYNPLLGKSYSEMAAESRSMHKSQGFGATARRGTRFDYFKLVAGEPASADVFDGIDTSWGRVPGGATVGRMLAAVTASFDPQRPADSVSDFLAVYRELTSLDETFWTQIKKQELMRVIQACAGLWMEAISPDFAAAPGDEVRVTTSLVSRSDVPFRVEKIGFRGLAEETAVDEPLADNVPLVYEKTIRLPGDFPVSQPYWLKAPPGFGIFTVREQQLIGEAENPPSLSVQVVLSVGGESLEYALPVLYRWTDRVDGELFRAFEVRPRVTLQLEDKVSIFADSEPKEVRIKLMSHSPSASGRVRLKGNGGWQVSPAEVAFAFTEKYAEQQASFMVTPPERAGEALLTAEAEIGGVTMDRALVEISYPHINRQVYFPESRVKVVKLDVRRLGSRLGYIMGAGDEVPAGLRTLGYEVVELSDEALESADLSRFDAIITGIRAYNTRGRLKHTQPRLLKYVEEGGTLIVQYNVSRGLQLENLGPYPLTIGRDRVSMETAPVEFLDPQHPLLNFPNTITQEDLEGWVQERGLYFASNWDEKYIPVLTSHDIGEPDRKGGLLYARYGEGVFIYTGYSWFRQLPAGVPGAFRFFVNLIEAGKYHAESTER